MTVSPKTERALREAMERLLASTPERTDGKLTKNNLCREGQVSRATMNRATDVLSDWDSRVGTSPAGLREQQRDAELTELRSKLRKSREQCRQLQDQVDAAATVIMTLLSENAALREHTTNSAAVIPLPLDRAVATRE
ncbi:hypothetical protein QF034_008188 [Streptomyces africanus]|uniref:Uncharacterized protein n=1 Tax=Streptomyces africanus TaxID=231024 RepID=A0ABU0R5Q5_9ACTN|nr:hypothetical protein [Streptomyces africanus]MDQ0753957.1 hypothetical protein [Streptomyces africanus]